MRSAHEESQQEGKSCTMGEHIIPTVRHEDFAANLQFKAHLNRQPVEGQWEITFRCNLRCVHCYVVENPAKKELTFPEITDILDELHKEGCFWLCFSGGEPLLREDFLEIYSYAIKKGFLVTLFTNGTLITPAIADYLKEYPPFRVEISLYGILPQTYEGITRVPGSFDKCQRGIHLLLERGLPLTLKTIGMTLNCHEIVKIKKYAQELENVKFRYDSLIIPRLDGSKEPCQFRLPAHQVVEIEYSDDTMRQEWKKCLQSCYQLAEPENPFRCAAGISSFNISPYGELQLCHLVRSPSFDLHKDSFREGFYHLFPQIRSAKYHPNSKCKDCGLWHLCPQCPGRAQLENGDPQMPVHYFCQLAHKRDQMKALLVE